jgi:hypothetical protein
MNHNFKTPARLNNVRSDPSASTIRRTSLVQWSKTFETPMFDSVKTPHQIANELRKTDYGLDTPPSFVLQSRTSIRDPNESFEIGECEISMLLSEDFPELDQRESLTPKTARREDQDSLCSTETLPCKRSCDVALDSLDYLVSTSPCKQSRTSCASTPRMPLSRKSRRPSKISQVLSFKTEDDLSPNNGMILEKENGTIETGESTKEVISASGESIDSVSQRIVHEVEVRFWLNIRL